MEGQRSQQHRTDRLAEMVWHLTDCRPWDAVDAVDRAAIGPLASHDDKLATVAQAICLLRRIDLREKVDVRAPLAPTPR